MKPITLALFGDQTVEKLSSIQALVRNSKTSPAARRFLNEATDILQLNLARLSKEDRRWTHDIHTLLGLAEDNINEEDPNGIIATVLMCIGRLGELIVFAEEDPSILGSETSPVLVLAYCTGLLPAAALVVAKDTGDLFGLAREIISITFRMAYEITRRMRLIEGSNGDWAMTLVGVTVEKAQPILDQFHDSQKIPYPKRIAIGIVSRGWLTLVGAPSSLNRLFEWSTELDQAPRTRIDTNGPIHTPYLPSFNMDEVLGDSPLLNTPITSKARIISPGSCKPYVHATLRDLLAEMLVDIAHNVLHLAGTTEACIAELVGMGPVNVVVAGPTGHLPILQRTLQEKGIAYDIRKHHDATQDTKRSRGGSDQVAIVGMGGRFPGSDTIDGFWEDLVAGKIQIQKIPKSRFDLDLHYDPSGEKRNSTSAQHGAFLNNPGLFDHRLFNISPREAIQMDPLQRLLLHVSYEALEMAGYSTNGTLATNSNRIATYFGQASEDWREVLNNQGIDIYYVPGLARPFAPSKLNYHYKWGGGSYALDAACATSTTAITLACSALLARECDTALAGGGSILLSPNSFSGLSRSGMISETGGCRTYHDDADGYARGEGIGIVVLKRLEDALADNDNILAVIKGSARTYTSTSTSITHPSAESQVRIYEEVLRQTSTVPNEISYVEMHGTGTQAGDFEEMSSVIKVMGQGRSKTNILTVGAVKANVGHGEAVAGVTSIIKSIMMMREARIPTQPGLPFKLNQNFPKLDKVHVQIAGNGQRDMSLRASPAAQDGKIKIMVNSFDASGGNTSVLLEEPPQVSQKTRNPLPRHVVAVSGRSPWSLQENTRRLLTYLMRNSNVKLADVAYTTTARRMHENLRLAYTTTSTKELISFLKADVSKNGTSERKRKPPKLGIVFAFTGQGSQYAGMGKTLYQHSTAFREILYTYQQFASSHGLPDFSGIISGDDTDISTASVVRVQLATVALEIATAQLLKAWGVVPGLVLGHSLGEYSALCVSGVLSVSDTLYLVGKRAMLMEEILNPGDYSMLAIGESVETVSRLLRLDSGSKWSQTDIACVNAPAVTVVSGPASEISTLKHQIEGDNRRATVLQVPYGFHSKHVDPILQDFEVLAKGVTFSNPKIPVASTLTGEVVPINKSDVFSPSYLIRQARESVKLVPALETCKAAGFVVDGTHWIEIGPEAVCLGLIRRTLEVSPTSLLPIFKSTEDNWATISWALASLYRAGAAIDWNEYHKGFKDSLSLLDLPTYAFDAKDFWIPYVEPILQTSAIDDAKVSENDTLSRPVPEFSTTDLQWVEDVENDGKTVVATFGSHTSNPLLYQAIQGHKVQRLAVCSLSIFCSMAKSATQYAYSKVNQKQRLPKMTILNMEMKQALVVNELNREQIVKTTVSYSASGQKADISFHSITSGVPAEHGSCQVILESDTSTWLEGRSDTLFLINARIESLKSLGQSGKAHRLLKPVIYKLFDNVVQYGREYQGLEEVWLDSEFRDAVGTVKLPDTAGKGNFLYDPFWSDTVVHLAGFILNGNLKYPEDIACLSTGFESWRSFEELKPDTTYTTYVTMHEAGDGLLLSGVAYVFSGSALVMVTSGIKFQKMSKIALGAILQSTKPSRKKGVTATINSTRTPQQSEISLLEKAMIPTFQHDSDSSSVGDMPTPDTESSGIPTRASSVNHDDDTNIIDTLFSIVATESGYSLEEVEPSTSFADMGLDSLMAITILAKVKRDTGVELPATFFLDNATVEDAKAALGLELEPNSRNPELSVSIKTAKDISAAMMKHLEAAPENETTLLLPVDPIAESSNKTRKESLVSRAVLLQGSFSSPGPNLFLFPDGSGSPVNYIQLPALGADVSVYGIESPFLKDPSEFTCSVAHLADIFLTAIKKQKPTGPYLLGGFSFGALYAYEVARKLLENNDMVDGLLIIDMPVPKGLSSPLSPTFEELSASGFVSPRGRLTAAQKIHLKKTVQAMTGYNAVSCSVHHQPKRTILISSKSGLATAGLQESSELVKWVRHNSSSPSQGWQSLVGDVDVYKVDADHFALFKYPTISILGEKCEAALKMFAM